MIKYLFTRANEKSNTFDFFGVLFKRFMQTVLLTKIWSFLHFIRVDMSGLLLATLLFGGEEDISRYQSPSLYESAALLITSPVVLPATLLSSLLVIGPPAPWLNRVKTTSKTRKVRAA